MHIKRCARRQNMYIIASLKHALPPHPQGSIRSKKNSNNNFVLLLYNILYLSKTKITIKLIYNCKIFADFKS